MRAEEIHGTGRAVGDGLGTIVRTVQGVHRAVAARVFTSVGPASAPVQVAHDEIADLVYALLGGTHQLVPAATAAALAGGAAGERSLSATPRGNALVGALNGAFGDRLAERDDPLAVTLAVRVDHDDVDLTPQGIAAAFPAAGSRIVVLVHGLCSSEDAWYGQPDAPDRTSYGERLRDELGWTPVFVRYNSGRHISENGRDLSARLDELVAHWPVPVAEVALIGHSMGGLVARSAAHHGELDGRAWVGPLRHVVGLGAPHLGAPLEKGVSALTWALARFPESSPVAELVNRRSAGIKDLRHGALVDEDWADVDPDAFLGDRCAEVPFVEHAAYSFVGVTISSDPAHPVGRALGDWLVRHPSATGTAGRSGRRGLPVEVGRSRHLGGLHHMDLLHHDEVYALLVDWLSAPSP